MHPHNDEAEEGWYTDPFGRHEARWISDGRPTRLVRDGGVDSYDEPPDVTPSHEAVRIDHPEAQRAGDLRRADSAEAGEPFDEAADIDDGADVVSESTLD
ncbi:MAG: hypothetical protein JOZ75_12420 [Candidatus Dormibacteraeota bacterium]|nr:hypothetical protein [Candidatus Dormibacteraeota bacterium]